MKIGDPVVGNWFNFRFSVVNIGQTQDAISASQFGADRSQRPGVSQPAILRSHKHTMCGKYEQRRRRQHQAIKPAESHEDVQES